MVKHIIICDRCKKQLGENEKTGHIAIKRNIAVYDNMFAKADFCGECIDEIVSFIRYGKKTALGENNGAENGISQKKEQPSPEQQKQPRRKTDYGKILALSNAGWDNTKIADEMGMTPQQVSNAKYVAKKKLEDGTLVPGSGEDIDFVGGD